MLNSLRQATNNIFLRAFIVLIVVAFIVWGLSDLFNNKSDVNVAQFKYASAITRNELINAIRYKKRFMQNDANFDDAEFAKVVLQDLVRERLVTYLINDLGISLDHKKLMDIIKNFPELQNKNDHTNHHFDKYKFQNMLHQLGITEEQYLQQINKAFATEMLYSILDHSNYQTSSLTDAIGSFLAEERTVSVLIIDKQKLRQQIKKPTDNELKAFFEANLETFRVPATHDIKYIVLDKEFFIKQKLLNNSDDLDSLKTLFIDYEKLLENEVASGSSIDDIAKKIHANALSIGKASLYNLIETKDVGQFTSQIFELQANELSYPFYLDNQKIVLAQVENIYPSHLPKLDDIAEKVRGEFLKITANDKAKEILEEIRQTATAENLHNFGKQKNIKILSKINISKNSKPDQHKLPIELFSMLFMVPKNSTTSVYMDNNYGYIAYIDNVKTNQELKNSINKENIIAITNQGYIIEILQHISQFNNIALNYHDPIFQE